ncbi:hypothetical protein GCM10022221_46720 [Actinocorallia aurea]
MRHPSSPTPESGLGDQEHDLALRTAGLAQLVGLGRVRQRENLLDRDTGGAGPREGAGIGQVRAGRGETELDEMDAVRDRDVQGAERNP